MTNYRDVFKEVTGKYLYPGTINVDVGKELPIRANFRIKGGDIGEPEQDLLFEHCSLNGHPAYRIRPYHLSTGQGGHGDHILEIACSKQLQNVEHGATVEVEFFRD